MKRYFNVGIVAVLMGLGLAGRSQSITKSAGFLRTTIESYPEAERRPILLYLDAARTSANRASTLLASGHSDEVFQEIVASAKAGGETLDIRPGVAYMQNAYGTLTHFEYRSQALEFSEMSADVHDLSRATSATFYAAKTTKRPDGRLFLVLKTMLIGTNHKVFFINYVDYGTNVPPWLQAKSQAKRQ